MESKLTEPYWMEDWGLRRKESEERRPVGDSMEGLNCVVALKSSDLRAMCEAAT